MIELEKAKDKKLTLQQIKQVYDPDYIFTRRIQHMLETKYIAEEAGFYKNVGRGRLIGKFFQFLKDYLNLGIGG